VLRSAAEMRRPIAMALLMLSVSCATAAPGPADTARAYAEALREGNAADAWQLLSRSAREAMTFEQFERSLRDRPDEVRALASAWSAVTSDDGVTARLELPDGDTLTLRSEGGRWRLDPAALDFYPQSTPRQTLRSFARALRRGRWEVLLRMAPRAVTARLEGLAARGDADGGTARSAADVLREAWSGREADAVAHTAEQIEQALERGRAIEVAGERATMTYGPSAGSIARLVREGGLWRVEHSE